MFRATTGTPDNHRQFRFHLDELRTEQRDDGADVGVFTGYASTFGNKDSYGTVFDKGAFKRTLKNQNGVVYLLADHGWRHADRIGLIHLEEDDKGLKVTRGELNLGKDSARAVYEDLKYYQDQKPLGLSVGFSVPKHGWYEDDDGTIHFKEVRLFEVSVVTFAANEQAGVTNVKSAHHLATAAEIFDVNTARLDEPDAFERLDIALQTARTRVLGMNMPSDERAGLMSAVLDMHHTATIMATRANALRTDGGPETPTRHDADPHDGDSAFAEMIGRLRTKEKASD